VPAGRPLHRRQDLVTRRSLSAPSYTNRCGRRVDGAGRDPFNEMIADGARPSARTTGPYSTWLAATPAGAHPREAGRGRPVVSARRHHLRRLRRRRPAPSALIPFDIVPRIIPAAEWDFLRARPAPARDRAQSPSSHDVYHDQEILRAGRIPADAGARATRSTGPRCRASTCRRTSMRTSRASISCAPAPASTTCSRTTCACRRACPTCSRTAR
jgi:hypothetical protein